MYYMFAKPSYYLLVMGKSVDNQESMLISKLTERMRDLELDHALVKIIHASDTSDIKRSNKYPLIALYFGSVQVSYTAVNSLEEQIIRDLIEASIQIIPIVDSIETAKRELPNGLHHINAIPKNQVESRLVNLILESFRLLRQERRLFISYKRLESSSIAAQLYDELDAKGFDVFLDSRSVPFGVDFQEVLWHRMVDSDVVVLIDSPTFKESRWTIEEIHKANETNIQIIYLMYPGQKETQETAFCHLIHLEEEDYTLDGDIKKLNPKAISVINSTIEEKRARALAARYRYLVDNFCDICSTIEVQSIVHLEKYIVVGKGDIASKLFVIPAIGIPDSKLLGCF